MITPPLPNPIQTGTKTARPLLVVCRSEPALTGLPRIHPDRPIVVASDDPRVQFAAGRHPGVCQTSYIEQIAPFHTVATEVRATVEKIDDWLASFAGPGPEITEEILRWGCTVEGGMTSQRVQDALLLIDSYQGLIDRIQPAAILLLSTARARWDDRVLAQVAALRGIPFQQQFPPQLPRWAWAVTAWVRPCALVSYRLLQLVRQGGGRPIPRRTPARDSEGRVVFVLCSSALNHWDNIKHVMVELMRQGAACLVLRWHATERMTLRGPVAPPGDAVIPSHQLERWVGLRDVWTAFRLARRCRRRIIAAQDKDPVWSGLVYRGVPLAPLLTESLRHFLIADLPTRIVFYHALRSAFGSAVPAAIKPWGAPEGFEYRAISRLWPQSGRPLIFQYWLGASIPWPYSDPGQCVDLFLAKTASEAAHVASDYCLSPGQIELVGNVRLSAHRQFVDVTPQATSRALLGLPDRPGALYVGFDPNCALRGYQSAREQAEITQALLTAASQTPNIVLVVKPHPAYPIDHLAPLFAAANNPHVVVLPREARLPHFLNAIDVLIAKNSTLLLEAALMRRISIAVIIGGYMSVRVFGELAPVFSDPAVLARLLGRLANEPAERAAWIAERLAHQEDCLKRDCFTPTNPAPAARAAAAIIAHAGRHHSD